MADEPAGARVARRLCPRLGLSPHQTELVAWLIEEHPDYAQYRLAVPRRLIPWVW